MLKNEIGQQLNKAMFESGINQSLLAKKIGIKQTTISQIKSGTCFPSIQTLYKIAKATGKSIGYFFGEENRTKYYCSTENKTQNIPPTANLNYDLRRKIDSLNAKLDLILKKLK